MSFIDSEVVEECITDASMSALENALRHHGYSVTRTNLQITAKYGGVFKTNGKFSTITIVDMGDYRQCRDLETAKGILFSPKRGVLAKIVAEAESCL